MGGEAVTFFYDIFIEKGKLKTITGGGVVNYIEECNDVIGINVESTRSLIATEHYVRSSVIPPFSRLYWYIRSYW